MMKSSSSSWRQQFMYSLTLCFVGRMREFPESDKGWESRLAWFKGTHKFRELNGIDGEPVEFEWMIFRRYAIMRHGSTWILSICAIPNHITNNLTDEFYSKSVLRHIITGSRKGASATSWATIRSLRDRATIRTRSSILCENLYTPHDLIWWRFALCNRHASGEACFSFRPLFSCFILVCFEHPLCATPSRTPRHGV